MKKLIITNLILAMILCIIPKGTKKIEVAVVNETVVNNVEQISNRNLTENREKAVEIPATNISQEGIDLIKRFERLQIDGI